MAQIKKEKAIQQVRVYKSTHKKLKVEAAKKGVTLAELIQDMLWLWMN